MRWPFGRAKTENDEEHEAGQELVASESSADRETDALAVVDDTKGTRSRAGGWGRLLHGNRVIWVVAGIAVFSLVAGLLIGRFIVSPGQAAADAKAPEAGLITVPIESRVLANDVTIRGDATYADAVEVSIETGDLGGPAVITGRVPEVGATFTPGAVALEVTGRPVIVLPGDLPVYRTLRVGVSGPDVLQLKQALQALGINPGDASSSLFDAATAAAVSALYDRVGYPAPASPEGTAESVRSANDGVRAAQDSVAAAQRSLNGAQAGASAAERLAEDNKVRQAQRELTAAQNLVDDPSLVPSKADQVAAAQDALALAEANRAQVLAPRDASAEAASVASAQQQLSAAYELLEEARKGTLTFLPSSEVLYLPGLPRRVDETMALRGATIKGPVMRVSGATLMISGSASEADAKLIAPGDKAALALTDGTELTATVTSVAPAKKTTGAAATETGRFVVTLTPDELTPEQLVAIQGTNVKVSIPVSATDGEVLAVPLAALTAGAGGESRIEVSTGDGDKTELVEVSTGLAAGGYVEIIPVGRSLEVGELVVVGR